MQLIRNAAALWSHQGLESESYHSATENIELHLAVSWRVDLKNHLMFRISSIFLTSGVVLEIGPGPQTTF